jgi:internalin A
MNKSRRTSYRPALVALFFVCALDLVTSAQTETKAAPKPLPPEVGNAWRDAGFEAGWMKDMPPQSPASGFWQPWREKAELGAIPAFGHPERKAGGLLEKLPDPGTAFGLDFHCGWEAGITLRELAKLQNLQSLNIGAVRSPDRRQAYADFKDLAELKSLRALYLFYMPVTDADLKHLAGLRDLQVLDLSATRVTDAGLKELARLKELRWLNLSTPGVTANGITALQKELPKCKIVTYEE